VQLVGLLRVLGNIALKRRSLHSITKRYSLAYCSRIGSAIIWLWI